MKYTWVIGQYDGERAKSVKEHANAGVGYFILEENNYGRSSKVRAAFRFVMDRPVPQHLEVAPKKMIDKLEKKFEERHNLHMGKPERAVANG